jgi:hypothetical protein
VQPFATFESPGTNFATFEDIPQTKENNRTPEEEPAFVDVPEPADAANVPEETETDDFGVFEEATPTRESPDDIFKDIKAPEEMLEIHGNDTQKSDNE